MHVNIYQCTSVKHSVSGLLWRYWMVYLKETFGYYPHYILQKTWLKQYILWISYDRKSFRVTPTMKIQTGSVLSTTAGDSPLPRQHVLNVVTRGNCLLEIFLRNSALKQIDFSCKVTWRTWGQVVPINPGPFRKPGYRDDQSHLAIFRHTWPEICLGWAVHHI